MIKVPNDTLSLDENMKLIFLFMNDNYQSERSNMLLIDSTNEANSVPIDSPLVFLIVTANVSILFFQVNIVPVQ